MLPACIAAAIVGNAASARATRTWSAAVRAAIEQVWVSHWVVEARPYSHAPSTASNAATANNHSQVAAASRPAPATIRDANASSSLAAELSWVAVFWMSSMHRNVSTATDIFATLETADEICGKQRNSLWTRRFT